MIKHGLKYSKQIDQQNKDKYDNIFKLREIGKTLKQKIDEYIIEIILNERKIK